MRAEQIRTFLLCFTAFGMANLNLFMSIGTIGLLVLWFFHPGPREGWKRFLKNLPAVAMAGLFLLHILWVVNTEDLAYAAKDLRIKLPLLVFALVLGGSYISSNQVKYVFVALGLGIWTASVRAYLNYLSVDPNVFSDFRDIVEGVSHIRLSLMMVLFTAAALHYRNEMGRPMKVFAVLTVLNILFFFNLIQSASGVVILTAVAVLTLFYLTAKHIGPAGVAATVLILGIAAVAGGLLIKDYYGRYFVSDEPLTDLPAFTDMGNPYVHNTEIGQVENGHYTFLYVAEDEMAAAWQERSTHRVDGEDNILRRAALIRYLTSKGMTKDRAGVYALSEEDIRNIENGYPSIVYTEKKGLSLRFHTTVFGYHQFLVTGSAGGSSLFQRLVYWRAAFGLIREFFWTGTGTGDVKQAFAEAYAENSMNLAEEFRLRAHNQYLTFFVSFGIFGFLYFVALFFVPFAGGRPSYLHLTFLLIAFAACLTEDTLETQAGVTFFAFFYGLFSERERTRSRGSELPEGD